ncbi:cytochrome c-type biogenesis protein [Salinisphaera aquimarina]|uniref:Cytochrome c-type biogenesis protein n=1 Tax=Salinisphaera aquimarina TaxID=2094031 RepID=A0ABV7EUE3_9GAMM
MRGLIGLLLMTACLVASAAGPELTASQQARYHQLNAELRCLICQNRTIAESDAPLAKDLRAIVARDIVAGKSDAEIKQYLVDRYGEWVLYDPPFQFTTLILWLGPFVLLFVGLGIAVVVIRRREDVRTTTQPPLDRTRLAQVLDDDAPDNRTASKDRS